MSRSSVNRPVDWDLPVSLVAHGSGVSHHVHNRRVGSAQEILSKNDKYGICCLEVAKQKIQYVEKANKDSASFIPEGDKDIVNKMKKCDLMAVCKGKDDCKCSNVLNKTVEYHKLRKESLKDVRDRNRDKMAETTQSFDGKIRKHQEELQRLMNLINETKAKLEEMHAERAKEAKPFLDEQQNLDIEITKTEQEIKDALALKDQEMGNYEEKRTGFENACHQKQNSQDLGCCCELEAGKMYVLKPATKFAYVKCLKKGLYRESATFYYSCGIAATKPAFFHECSKCNHVGNLVT